MYARAVRSTLPADKLDQATSAIQQNSPGLKQAPGFQHAVWFYDRETSALTAVVVFDSQANSDAAWETLGKAATERIRALGGTPMVSGGEVIHHL
jgi:hypothetical protein